jgi:transposase
LTATGQVPTRGRRHPMTVITAARRLAEADWRPFEIVEILQREYGVTVERNTVARWIDPAKQQAADQRARQRRRREAAEKDGRIARHITRCATGEFKFARMRALRDRGLSPAAIATVIEFDFGDPINRWQVEYAFRSGRYPRGLS